MKLLHLFDAVAIILIVGFSLTINSINKQKVWALEEISFQSSLNNSDPSDYSFYRMVESKEKRYLSFRFDTNEPRIIRLLISARESSE